MGILDRLFHRKKPTNSMEQINDAWERTDAELDRQVAKGMDGMPADEGEKYVGTAQNAAMTNYAFLMQEADKAMDETEKKLDREMKKAERRVAKTMVQTERRLERINQRMEILAKKNGMLKGGTEITNRSLLAAIARLIKQAKVGKQY